MFSKIGKLLLVTDGSIFSGGAIREAILLAKRCSSLLCTIFVLETNPEYETIGSNYFEREEAEATAHLESIKARALQEGVHCETIFHRGDEVHRSVVDEAVERKADMIVIGRRGRKGLAKLLIGDVAAKVIGHAPCNVLVVPKAARIRCKNILVATNGSPHSATAVSTTIEIAKCYNSSIVVVSVMSSEAEQKKVRSNVDKVVELAREEGLAIEAVTPIGHSYDAVLEVAGGRGVDLIVMGTYGRNGVKKFLAGSTTEKVIGNTACAVLVVKSGEES